MSGRRGRGRKARTVECRCLWTCPTNAAAAAAQRGALDRAKADGNEVLVMMITAALHGPHRWRSPAELQQAVRG